MKEHKRALIIATTGFEDIEAVAVIDVLNRVGVQVTIASTEPGMLKAAYGTTIVPHTTVDSIEAVFDAVIIPGGKANSMLLASNPKVIKILRQHFNSGKLVAAICAAPSLVLGEGAQILQGKRATGDPGFLELLAASGAEVCAEPVCIDGNLITATGPGTALAFALSVAAYLVGKDEVLPYSEKWGVECRV